MVGQEDLEGQATYSLEFSNWARTAMVARLSMLILVEISVLCLEKTGRSSGREQM